MLGVRFMAYTCGWGSLQVRFKTDFLKFCWVCAPPQNVMLSIFLVSVNKHSKYIGCVSL